MAPDGPTGQHDRHREVGEGLGQGGRLSGTAGVAGPVGGVTLRGEAVAGRAAADDKDARGAVVPPAGLSPTGSGGIGTTRVSDGDVGDAHVVTHGKG